MGRRHLLFPALLVTCASLLTTLIHTPPAAGGEVPYVDWASLEQASKVEFRSGATPTDRWGVAHERVQGLIRRPRGEGPFPAVVLLPPSYWGIGDHHIRWVERLAEWGYVALLVNTVHRFEDSDEATRASDVEDPNPETVAHDAYGAMAFLRRQSFVNGNRVAVIGWAEGGSAILQGLQDAVTQPGMPRAEFAADTSLRFRAGVAYYPVCARGSQVHYYAPVLILIGERNHYSVEDCVNLGGGVRVKVYPGATFLFDIGTDVPEFFPGADSVYDPVAERDAIGQVRSLLASRLQ